MATYHHSLDQALAVPLALAWAFRAAAIEQNPMLSVRRASPGYIAQD